MQIVEGKLSVKNLFLRTETLLSTPRRYMLKFNPNFCLNSLTALGTCKQSTLPLPSEMQLPKLYVNQQPVESRC